MNYLSIKFELYINISDLEGKNSCFPFFIVNISLFLLIINVYVVKSQTLPVGISENVENFKRVSQLLGEDTLYTSYMIRPVVMNQYSIQAKSMKFLPVLWRQQYNTKRAYGVNEGAMIPSNGYETMISGGIFMKYGPLSIQLRPEFVLSENKDYQEIHETNNGQAFQNAISARLNRIDLPSRFGNGSYADLNWGESNIKLTFGKVSFALSNENLWWGPGIHNSLLMSNNAPGFKHLSLNTNSPIKTAIGSFEGQLIGGRLENSGVHDLEGTVFAAKRKDWRYLSGMIITYQPKWIPYLYVGFDRSFMIYRNDMESGLADYFPLFSSLAKKNFNNAEGTINAEDQRNRDQYFSFFARWVLPESKSEVYVQYGRNDFAWDLRDGVVEPEHSRAYIAGYQKLIPLHKIDEYIQFGIEVTTMKGSGTGQLRDQPPWYTHSRLPAGYTHKGQILGAAVGTENNQQSVTLNWLKGLRRIGLTMTHIVNDPSLSRTVVGERKNWTDLAFIGNYDWTYKGFIINSRLGFVRSNNYLYENKENNPNNNLNNMHLQLGLLYNL